VMRILRADDYRRMPWKNGKGETVEIAVFPPDASVNDFGWRISMATVTTDGPFSTFEDIDRTLSVLQGEGMTLSVDGMEPVLLGTASAPFFFPGDRKTDAVLTSGGISDLNVMTRRGRFRHHVERVTGPHDLNIAATQGVTLVVVTRAARFGELPLGPLDTVLLDAKDAPAILSLGDAAVAYVIKITE
jgi:uncharacterized protein